MRRIATLPLAGLFASLLLGGFTGTALAEKPDGQRIDYQVGDEIFSGYLASAPDEARGTVLIIHDWDGLTDYERQRADMLAAQATTPSPLISTARAIAPWKPMPGRPRPRGSTTIASACAD